MKKIAVHHTAVARNGKPQLYAVDRYHRDKWGMKSSLGWYVGYNFFVDDDGTLTQCRVLDEETVANVGHNCDVPERCDVVSICFAGNGDVERLNHEQEKTWVDFLKKYPLEIDLHRNIQDNRTCPGKLIDIPYLKQTGIDNTTEKSDEILRLQKEVDTLRALVAKLITVIFKKRV